MINDKAVGPGLVLGDRFVLTAPMFSEARADLFAATDLASDEVVAVRILAAVPSDCRTALDYFASSRPAFSVATEGLATVHAWGLQRVEDVDVPWVAMDLVPGVTLATYVDQAGPLPLSTALDLTISLLTTLSYTHRHGVVHRDLSAASIVVSIGDAPQATLVDLGLTCCLPAGGAQTTGFEAPEVIAGHRPTESSDLYAVGAVLRFMLAGQPGPAALDVPPTVEELLRVATAPSPKGRPESAEAMRMYAFEARRDVVDLEVGTARRRQGAGHQTGGRWRDAVGALGVTAAAATAVVVMASLLIPSHGSVTTNPPLADRSSALPSATGSPQPDLSALSTAGAVSSDASSGPTPAKTVPALAALPVRRATAVLRRNGLVVGSVTRTSSSRQAGTVLAQTPAVGAVRRAGDPVNLQVASGFNTVPDVRQQAQDSATSLLGTAGFRARVVYLATASADPGTVVRTEPAAQSLTKVRSTLLVVVASDPPTAEPTDPAPPTDPPTTSAPPSSGPTTDPPPTPEPTPHGGGSTTPEGGSTGGGPSSGGTNGGVDSNGTSDGTTSGSSAGSNSTSADSSATPSAAG